MPPAALVVCETQGSAAGGLRQRVTGLGFPVRRWLVGHFHQHREFDDVFSFLFASRTHNRVVSRKMRTEERGILVVWRPLPGFINVERTDIRYLAIPVESELEPAV